MRPENNYNKFFSAICLHSPLRIINITYRKMLHWTYFPLKLLLYLISIKVGLGQQSSAKRWKRQCKQIGTGGGKWQLWCVIKENRQERKCWKQCEEEKDRRLSLSSGLIRTDRVRLQDIRGTRRQHFRCFGGKVGAASLRGFGQQTVKHYWWDALVRIDMQEALRKKCMDFVKLRK